MTITKERSQNSVSCVERGVLFDNSRGINKFLQQLGKVFRNLHTLTYLKWYTNFVHTSRLKNEPSAGRWIIRSGSIGKFVATRITWVMRIQEPCN